MSAAEFSLSALGGGEGRGEVGGPSATKRGTTHLTLPAALRQVPSLSPRKRAERANFHRYGA